MNAHDDHSLSLQTKDKGTAYLAQQDRSEDTTPALEALHIRRQKARALLKVSHHAAPETISHECLRAEHEDDDGYDPFSDRKAACHLFEPQPWK